MIRRFFPPVIILLVLLSVAGCKSSPAAPDEPPAQPEQAGEADAGGAPKEAPTKQPAASAEQIRSLEAAAARLEKAHEKAHYFGGPEFLRDETAAADAIYPDTAGGVSPSTSAEADALIAEYTRLAETYEGIFERALPQYAEKRVREVKEAREEAVSMGAVVYSPERFNTADDIADEAQNLYRDEGDVYGAKDLASLAESGYRALARIAEARSEASEIEFYHFEDIDPDQFEEAGRILEDANRIFDEGLGAREVNGPLTAGQTAERSLVIYHDILNRGMRSYADERRLAAEAERRSAETVKANVAVRADFENAVKVFDLGQRAYGQEQYRDAANLYFQAEFSFAAAAGAAEEKRARAEAAIRRAEEVTAASEEVARSAENLVNEGDEERRENIYSA
jgi:hypothetical protein